VFTRPSITGRLQAPTVFLALTAQAAQENQQGQAVRLGQAVAGFRVGT
jgi:hypothetical protein